MGKGEFFLEETEDNLHTGQIISVRHSHTQSLETSVIHYFSCSAHVLISNHKYTMIK